MEDFNTARAAEPVHYAGLQAEWLENQKAFPAVNKVDIAMAQTSDDQTGGPGKDVATRLDGELRSFADSKQDNADAHMLTFQKLVGDYCDNSDKHDAMQRLGDATAALRVSTANEVDGLNKQVDAAIAQNPAEQAQAASFDATSQQFFGAVQALPFAESSKILDLMGWQDGENKGQHDARVAAGLSADPKLQASFNQMAAAEDRMENSKSPQQKLLEAEVKQDNADIVVMNGIVNKAYIRSEIP